jgi:hypothetical protein
VDSGQWTVEREKAKGERRKGNKWTVDSGQLKGKRQKAKGRRRKGNKWTVDSGQLKGRDLKWDLQDFVTMILICIVVNQTPGALHLGINQLSRNGI